MFSSILGKIGAEHAVMITSNGARVRDLKGTLFIAIVFQKKSCLSYNKIPFDRTKICINTYQDDGWFINIDVPELAKYHKDSGFMYEVVDFTKHHGRGTEKVFFIARDPKILWS